MRLEIIEALHLLLALPAHRSHNESHRQIGKTALKQRKRQTNRTGGAC